jgi:hypothetical protein
MLTAHQRTKLFAAPSAKINNRNVNTIANDWSRHQRTSNNTIPPKNAIANSAEPSSSGSHRCGA